MGPVGRGTAAVGVGSVMVAQTMERDGNWKGVECIERICGGGYKGSYSVHTSWSRVLPFHRESGNLTVGQAVFERAIKKNKYHASPYIYYLIP